MLLDGLPTRSMRVAHPLALQQPFRPILLFGQKAHAPLDTTGADVNHGSKAVTVQVVGHHLHRQPGGVGGEAPRGEMVEPDAVLEVSDGVLDLGVAPMVASSSRVSPSRSVMKP